LEDNPLTKNPKPDAGTGPYTLEIREFWRGFGRPIPVQCGRSKQQEEAGMMDRIFDWCVNVLVYWAGTLGMTYKEINVWVFVILWPILTVALIGIIFLQHRKIRKLLKLLP
jgi:hypothetical protein